ncbi:hypothetical protein INT47_001207 [Mucor saturninus]|uniref:J domain-containing protein n=1 Tax=Mucor saturninus TaxID=64648 RepID=A0A8H7VEW8_9FUNG|nr:hypothetical protein INT47_001207 [Mucor saturninus]
MFKRAIHSSVTRQKRYYDILQLKESADKRTIKSHYYRLSKKYHPDLNPNNKQAHQRFLEINEAYGVLGNEASKRKYDNESHGHSSSHQGHGHGHVHSAAKYSRSGGGGGNKQAWHFRNRKATKGTGSTSAQEQAERMRNPYAGNTGFTQSNPYNQRYEAEEQRRRERVENATERRRAAGDSSIPGKVAPGMENLWGRLWRLSVVLTGIAYVAQKLQ